MRLKLSIQFANPAAEILGMVVLETFITITTPAKIEDRNSFNAVLIIQQHASRLTFKEIILFHILTS